MRVRYVVLSIVVVLVLATACHSKKGGGEGIPPRAGNLTVSCGPQ